MSLVKKIAKKVNYHRSIWKKKKYEVKNESKERMTNWTIIGLGNMANTFAQALSINPGANIVAVASRSQNKAELFAQKYNISKAFGSYEAMLKDETLLIDVVYIATPVFCHYENIKLALLNNKNVLCEKPISLRLEEFLELRELASQRELFLSEGMWMLYLPVFKQAKQWISQGKIGVIRSIRVDLSKRELLDYSNYKFSAREGCGVLLDYGIYALAFATNFMESPINITYCNSLINKEGFDKDWVIILNDMQCFATITISSDFDGCRKAVLFGENGTIEWNPQFNRTNIIKCINSDGIIIDSCSFKYQASGFEYEIDEVQTCLRNKKTETDIVPLNFSMKVLNIIESITN